MLDREGALQEIFMFILKWRRCLGIQRDGINLRSTISISYLDAIIGAVVKVKTVEGISDLQTPPGTQPGDVLVLARKGAPKLNKPSIRGDHLFTVKVTLPKCVSTKECALLEELSSLGNTTRSHLKSRSRTITRSSKGSTEGPAAQSAESPTVPIAEQSEQTEDQNDLWNKLKDFAGSVANGASNWLKDNLETLVQGIFGGLMISVAARKRRTMLTFS